MNSPSQQSVCKRIGIEPLVPRKGTKVGIALSTIGESPINGLRHQEENGTNGWYIWCGEEFSKDENFFLPLHVEHLSEYLPQVIPYLELPPGYRFLIDSKGYEDVWKDSELLNA